MEFLLFDSIQAGLGRLSLFLRYRKKERIHKVLEEKYEGSYSNAGKSLFLSLIAVFFILLLIGFLIAVLVAS